MWFDTIEYIYEILTVTQAQAHFNMVATKQTWPKEKKKETNRYSSQSLQGGLEYSPPYNLPPCLAQLSESGFLASEHRVLAPQVQTTVQKRLRLPLP